MRTIIALSLSALLAFTSAPAWADFKYTETGTVTGGSLKSAMKVVGIFSKQASQAMKPTTTTHYIKGNRLRTDNSDGKVQIIDLDSRRIIEIDPQKHSYSEITFEEMKAAIEKAEQQAQQQQAQQQAKQTPQQDPNAKDVNAKVNAQFHVTPGISTRQILGQTANEVKVQMDMEVQAQTQSDPQSGQSGGPVSGTITTSVDTWVAPSVSGYQDFSEFYRRMAQEVNWVPPANIQIDPRASQSLEELQRNSASLKGFPLLEYMSMSMAGQQGASASTAQNSNNSNSSSSDSEPTSATGAVVKGLGGLFGKKKKQDDTADSNGQNPPPSTPGSLIEMTIEVNSFSDAPLDGGLFDTPVGYTRVPANPDQILAPNRQSNKQ